MKKKTVSRAAWPVSIGLGATLALAGTVALSGVAIADEAKPGPFGTEAERPDPQTLPYLGWKLAHTRSGVFVTAVAPGGPADDAGVEARDEVVSLNGVVLGEPGAMREAMDGVEPGDTVVAVVLRDDRERTIRVETGSRADRPSAAERPYLGAVPARPVAQVEDGVVIGFVAVGSPAEAAGLLTGDVITAINGEDASDVRMAFDAIRAMSPGAVVTLGIDRDGTNLSITVTLGSQEDHVRAIVDRAGEAGDPVGRGPGGRGPGGGPGGPPEGPEEG